MENGLFAGRMGAQSRRLGLQNLRVGVQNSFDSMSVDSPEHNRGNTTKSCSQDH